MSAQPNQPVTDLDRQMSAELAVAVMLDHLALPALTMKVRPGVVHITVTGARELSQWTFALGGDVVHTDGADDVALWTLHTRTPARSDGSTVPVRVHAVVVAGEDVLTEVRRGVAL